MFHGLPVLLKACIQMYADSDHGCHEGIMFFPVDHHAVQSIIVQDTVIDPFRSGALAVNLLICSCTTWDCCIKADIPVRFCLYSPSIGRRRALVVTVVHFSHDERAAPHELSAGLVITVWNHAVSFAADRSAIFITWI